VTDEVKQDDQGHADQQARSEKPQDSRPAQPSLQPQSWTPASEHDQMTIVHASILQAHINGLVSAIQANAPEAVKQVHTDGIANAANALSKHVNAQVVADAQNKAAVVVAAQKKMPPPVPMSGQAAAGQGSGNGWLWAAAAVAAAVVAAGIAYSHGLVHLS